MNWCWRRGLLGHDDIKTVVCGRLRVFCQECGRLSEGIVIQPIPRERFIKPAPKARVFDFTRRTA